MHTHMRRNGTHTHTSLTARHPLSHNTRRLIAKPQQADETSDKERFQGLEKETRKKPSTNKTQDTHSIPISKHSTESIYPRPNLIARTTPLQAQPQTKGVRITLLLQLGWSTRTQQRNREMEWKITHCTDHPTWRLNYLAALQPAFRPATLECRIDGAF